MPKATFYNLDDEKKEKITNVLMEEFENKLFHKATVKSIVEKLQISRGSFYQYFDSLDEAYFYILETNLSTFHKVLYDLFLEKQSDMEEALDLVGPKLLDEIFSPKYQLYKNRTLYWNEDLDRKWTCYRNRKGAYPLNLSFVKDDRILFIKAVLHQFISKIFMDGLSRLEAEQVYQKYLLWLKKGVFYATI